HGGAVRGDERAHRVGMDVDRRDPAAVGEQGLDHRAAHGAAGTGDDGDLALEGLRVHVSRTLFFPNRPRERKVTTAMNSRYIDSSDHSEAYAPVRPTARPTSRPASTAP